MLIILSTVVVKFPVGWKLMLNYASLSSPLLIFKTNISCQQNMFRSLETSKITQRLYSLYVHKGFLCYDVAAQRLRIS